MTNTDNLRATTAADLLAGITLTIGYRPTDSLAVAGVRPSGHIGVVARIDLDDLDDVGPESTDSIAVAIANDRAERAIVAIYTDDVDQAHAVSGMITCALHGQALDVIQAIQVGDDTYLDTQNDDAQPRPLSDIEASPVAAHAVYMGRSLQATRADMLPRAASDEDRDTARAAYRLRMAEQDQGAGALTTWRYALTGVLSDPSVYGEIAATITDRSVRDAVLLTLVPGTDPQVADDVVAGNEPDDAVARAIGAVIDPFHAVKPDETTKAGADVLAQVVAHIPDSTPAWTLWAMLAWWGGNGVAARDGLAHAADDYRLAALLRQVVDSGIAPGWVRRQRDA